MEPPYPVSAQLALSSDMFELPMKELLSDSGSLVVPPHMLSLPACQIFVILSFVLRSTRRSALILISLLITAWALMYITRHAPRSMSPA